MIVVLGNVASSYDGTTKSISVFAMGDATGGDETLLFTIIDQHVSQAVTFAANEPKTITVNHTACGRGLVIVSSPGSKELATVMLDVDKQPGDPGF